MNRPIRSSNHDKETKWLKDMTIKGHKNAQEFFGRRSAYEVKNILGTEGGEVKITQLFTCWVSFPDSILKNCSITSF